MQDDIQLRSFILTFSDGDFNPSHDISVYFINSHPVYTSILKLETGDFHKQPPSF